MGFDAGATDSPDTQPWVAGARVGEHVLLSRLGAGGMGEVWLAELSAGKTRRAIKVLRAAHDPELRLRFAREGEAQARVDAHPNVLRVHGAGLHGGSPYLVLELAEGGDLMDRLAEGPLPPLEAARLVRDLAGGLAHSHARGVLHRDLKPQNVLFDAQGTPKLVDFGLARLAGADSLTNSSEVLGTPAYLAPEQAAGRCDERTDVYGLGTILYQVLTGEPPFQGPTSLKVLQAVLHTAPRPPGQLARGIPAGLEALCLTCLAKDPERRPASAAAVAEALEGVLRGTGPGGRSRAAAAALVVAALGASAALVWWARREAPLEGFDGPPVVGSVEAPPPAASPDPTPGPGAALPALAGDPAVWPEDYAALGPARDGPAKGAWSERIAAALAGSILPEDDAKRLGENEDEALAHFQRTGKLEPLRRAAETGNPRANLVLARVLLGLVGGERVVALDRATAEDEAAAVLWRTVQQSGGYPQAAALLMGLLLRGGTLDGARADPAAPDRLAELVAREDPVQRWSANERLHLVRIYVERGGPTDLLAATQALRRALGQLTLSDGERGRQLAEMGQRSSAAAVAWRVAQLEGWIEADTAEREAARRALEQLRWRPIVGRYQRAAAFAADPEPAAEAPSPLDLLALDGGSSVRRGTNARDRRDAERLRKRLVGREEALELSALARRGCPLAQWLLGTRPALELLEVRSPPAWGALGALDGQGTWRDEAGQLTDLTAHPQARLDAALDLLFGRLGPAPSSPAIALFVSLAQRSFGQAEDTVKQARLWLGLLERAGEWNPGAEGIDTRGWVESAWKDPNVAGSARQLEEPRAQALLKHAPP